MKDSFEYEIWILIIVCAVLFSSGVIIHFLRISPIFVGIANIIALITPLLPKIIRKHRKKKQAKKQNKEFEKEIIDFLTSKIDKKFSNLDISSVRTKRKDVYKKFIDKNFPDLDMPKKQALVLLSLCKVYSENKEIDVYENYQSYINSLSLYKVSEKSKPFLAAYNYLFNSERTFDKVEKLFDYSEFEEDELREILDDFIDNFSKKAPFVYFRDELRNSEEVNDTLLQLIKEEEFAAYGVKEETVRQLREKLWEELRLGSNYLILGNSLPDDLQDKFKSEFSRISGSVKSYVPDSDSMYFSFYLVKPDKYFRSSEEFYDEEVKPFFESYEKEYVGSVIPVNFTGDKIYINPESGDFEKETLKECHRAIKYFIQGYNEDIAIWKAISDSQITVEKLLSAIPFNILATDVTRSEKEFIIKHYKEIRSNFGVNSLEEWKDFSADEIKKELLSYGKPNYDEIEARETFNVSDPEQIPEKEIKERFEKISTDITENAKDYAEAIY